MIKRIPAICTIISPAEKLSLIIALLPVILTSKASSTKNKKQI